MNIPAYCRRQICTQANPRHAGFTIIELLIGVAVSLVIVAGLATLLVNLSSSNKELEKANSQIENGRFAIQVLQNDVMHAGFWGTFKPQFDDINWSDIPNDTPTAIPDPCEAYSDWDWADRDNLIGIHIAAYDSAPGSCTLSNRVSGTDVLVVRHAATCVAGATGCEANSTGKLYFQASECGAATYGIAQAGTTTSVTLQSQQQVGAVPGNPGSSNVTSRYNGMVIRMLTGAAAGQSSVITAYGGANYVATVGTAFSSAPTTGDTYTIVENILDTSGFTLHKRGANCAAAASADLRKFVSNIYWVRDYAVTAGDGIPTLVRSSFDLSGGTLQHALTTPDVVAEGIERFRVELGIDNTVKRCSLNTTTNYSLAISTTNGNMIDPATCTQNTATPVENTLPRFRGDGLPDEYKRCTTSSACTVANLRDVVAAKVFVLARASESSAGYTDNKTYCLGSTNSSGACPTDSQYTPAVKNYKRHAFTTTIRLVNVAGRRESPL